MYHSGMKPIPRKVCFKCGKRRSINCFYKHGMMADGHLNKCKDCAKQDVQDNYRKNRDKYREYDRQRFRDPERKKKVLEYARRLRKRYPEKYAARSKVARAIKTGALNRQPCEVCGTTERVHAHHDDYSKPLEVRWLCVTHHWHEHSNIRGE